MIDVQSQIIAELTTKLAAVPEFGQLVFEDSARRVLDTDDPDLPASFVILQQGETREVQRVSGGSLREQTTVHIVLVTSNADYAQHLRTARLHVKRIFSGRKAGMLIDAIQPDGTEFLTEVRNNPEAGQRMAAHAMPLQITYVQNYSQEP